MDNVLIAIAVIAWFSWGLHEALNWRRRFVHPKGRWFDLMGGKMDTVDKVIFVLILFIPFTPYSSYSSKDWRAPEYRKEKE